MFRTVAVLAALVTLPTASLPALSVSTASSRDASRAQASFAALERLFSSSDGSGLYREAYPPGKPHTRSSRDSYEWPFSQVHVAVLDLTGLPGSAGASYSGALTKADAAQMRYWSDNPPGGHPGFLSAPLPPYGNGGSLFYDDNEWAGLEAIQEYLQHDSKKALNQAKAIFELAVSGWDSNPSHVRPGGVRWTQIPGNTARNTVSNMPAAELGLRLYQVTGRKSYLSWAMKMYQWTNTNLQSSDGLYYDHITLNGHVDQTIWTYNQGVPIAVNLLLYRITSSASYLQEAERIASASYQYFMVGGRLQSQPVSFNAIFFKQLLALESATSGSKYRAAIQAYANTMWNSWRDPKSGLFHFAGESRTDVLEQAAATQIYATLALPSSALATLA
jgi:hypothetical protein